MATVPGKNPGILLELFAVVQASERNEGREGKEMEREKGRAREREMEQSTNDQVEVPSKLDLVVLHGAGHAPLMFGHDLRPQAAARKTELGKKPRILRTKLAPSNADRGWGAAAAGLEHPHHCKKACVSATAQCAP